MDFLQALLNKHECWARKETVISNPAVEIRISNWYAGWETYRIQRIQNSVECGQILTSFLLRFETPFEMTASLLVLTLNI